MEIPSTSPAGNTAGILGFLRAAKDEDDRPLRIGDRVGSDADSTGSGIAGPASDLRGLGIGRIVDVRA